MTMFEKWDKVFREQNMFAFNGNPNGVLWLKARAVCRHKLLKLFLENTGITLKSSTLKKQHEELFQVLCQMPEAMTLLDDFLRQRNHEWYVAMNVDEEKLKQDLYSIHSYEWGGDRNNSLDKYLVSKYVKTISCYDDLKERQGEIAQNAWNYVQTSWYNNWTSYLIESIFKHNERIVSAAGEIKSVDFFISDIPIDLKVTFFPNQFMEAELKRKLGKSELSWLKKSAKEVGIYVGSDLSEAQQKYILCEKLSDLGREDIVNDLCNIRREIIKEAEHDSRKLMQWLYENQGAMRFGAENRLYVVLVDAHNMADSWKMKRKFDLLESQINSYISSFEPSTLKEIDFYYNGRQYKSLADILFVIKDDPLNSTTHADAH